MRPEDILPDSVDHITIDGTVLRKGTVAAFLANATIWLDVNASAHERMQAEAEIADALPALRALGLFDVLEVRDDALRKWIEGH
ncbi:MAG TPA: hypothetical protein VL635_04315 [Trinickia sp.]|nr:hypothetical protein [Trinickia sp.]